MKTISVIDLESTKHIKLWITIRKAKPIYHLTNR